MFRDAKDTIMSATALPNVYNSAAAEIAGGSAASALDMKSSGCGGGADPIFLNVLFNTAGTIGSCAAYDFTVVTKAAVDVSTGAAVVATFRVLAADMTAGRLHCWAVSAKNLLRYVGVLGIPITANMGAAATATVWFSVNPETALQ